MAELLSDYIAERQRSINKALTDEIETLQITSRLKESMLYSVQAGGKRLRPILMMASCESFVGSYTSVVPVAVALEMIHTYSLIHDDLPAMDDDHLRRGKPTNHRQFDEATAILAGDALLTYSFEVITKAESLTEEQKIYLITRLAQASGPKGMVGGQMLDMIAEDQEVDLSALEQIHTLKTGQLLTFAIISGAYIAGASSEQLQAIEKFSYYLGLIFQVQDDILDVTGDPELIGKPIGSDETNNKSTYPRLLGLNGAINKKQEYVNKAKQALKQAGVNQTVLESLTDYLSNRDH
ncbi:polyprenyl synthetase family protein [Radiobacillus sp. PE A8.2]|uniref:polyprenyl synthetase family protein n=1 Tax=Radiobacillus sp. PE A8.2 TaxID=3380349 RepID=UPI00388D31F9